MKVEGVGYNVRGHTKKNIRDIVGPRVKNILYFIQTKGCWEAWYERNWKGLKMSFLRQQEMPRRTSWVLKILIFQYVKITYHI